MDLELKDKNCVVVGGSRGIGRSVALGLAAEGANMAICARGERRCGTPSASSPILA